ncbi:MAG: hypothetical protein CXT75_07355 [Methanobacteriota archaeon]|jgi:hypothetical protein|nr:MAG: hypothetical protein CXT75_07355 [Euryarchaeota archaeon]
MLRYSFLATSILSALNFLLTDVFVVQVILGICLVVSLGIAIIWPEPLPPPPSPDLWSEAPKTKEREMKICSNCGKAVDQKWSMCPYCSKKV